MDVALVLHCFLCSLINQLANHVNETGVHGVPSSPAVMELFVLVFADDVALLATTPIGLQNHSTSPESSKLSSKTHFESTPSSTIYTPSKKTALASHILRIKYKAACMCFNAITGSRPSYLSDLLHLYTPSRTLRSSSDTRLL